MAELDKGYFSDCVSCRNCITMLDTAAMTLMWSRQEVLKKLEYLYFLMQNLCHWSQRLTVHAQLFQIHRTRVSRNTHVCSVEQLRWRGYCSSRSDSKEPFWPLGQLPWTQASTLGKMLLYCMTPQLVLQFRYYDQVDIKGTLKSDL